MNNLENLKVELRQFANPERAKASLWFFKTGKGEYGEGDVFIGISGTDQRKIAKQYKDLKLEEIQELLNSKLHEYRQVAVLILGYKFEKSDKKLKKQIYDLYLKNTKNINNWDLVDVSAPHVIGRYLLDKNRDILYKLAKSKNLWERRISIISTFAFIRNNQYQDTFKIAKILLNDNHDLIHKAVGWMLREVGNRNQEKEEKFLKKNYRKMPRTMLRYAIEKFPEEKRQAYLKGKI
ncbi:MAG: DNA alkylation repair protein [archaeon]